MKCDFDHNCCNLKKNNLSHHRTRKLPWLIYKICFHLKKSTNKIRDPRLNARPPVLPLVLYCTRRFLWKKCQNSGKISGRLLFIYYVMKYLVSKSNVRLNITTVTGVVYLAMDSVTTRRASILSMSLVYHDARPSVGWGYYQQIFCLESPTCVVPVVSLL